MESSSDVLKLENQICFPLYAVSRLVIQQYKPLLNELDITYPQYLVLLVLWEKGSVPVKQIAHELLLETNTLTPLLKRMEQKQLITRNRSTEDERVVVISLTKAGKQLNKKATNIPERLVSSLDCYALDHQDSLDLKRILDKIVNKAKMP